jgi:hypothetical protein
MTRSNPSLNFDGGFQKPGAGREKIGEILAWDRYQAWSATGLVELLKGVGQLPAGR